jgi:hypothetical protein
MYSGTTIHNFSGNIAGAHQKIDRASLRLLDRTVNTKQFPSKKLILYFEGKNGPDGIKSKSPAQNEPWHFYDPFDPDDDSLLDDIRDHYDNLVRELKANNFERAGFEAAWLSHALVDGLTPAHHYPYEEELMSLRGGEGNETRNTLKEKLIMKGEKPSEIARNNWQAWGIKGFMISHTTFELGCAALIAPLNFNKLELSTQQLNLAKKVGIEQVFEQAARRVALWNLYDEYMKYGWTVRLANKVRDDLVPEMIKTVGTAWYLALNEAGYAGRHIKK